MGPVLTELFPTSVRGAGQGFCYDFGRGIGAFFPTLVGILSASVTLGTAIGTFAAISYAIVILAAIVLPEKSWPGVAGKLKACAVPQNTMATISIAHSEALSDNISLWLAT